MPAASFLAVSCRRRWPFSNRLLAMACCAVFVAARPGLEVEFGGLFALVFFGAFGCGEVTAIRLVMAANHAITAKRRQEHIAELERLLAALLAPVETDEAEPDRLSASVWLPAGTHDWTKFLKPEELRGFLDGEPVAVQGPFGVAYDPITGRWSRSSDCDINYMVTVTRDAA